MRLLSISLSYITTQIFVWFAYDACFHLWIIFVALRGGKGSQKILLLLAFSSYIFSFFLLHNEVYKSPSSPPYRRAASSLRQRVFFRPGVHRRDTSYRHDLNWKRTSGITVPIERSNLSRLFTPVLVLAACNPCPSLRYTRYQESLEPWSQD